MNGEELYVVNFISSRLSRNRRCWLCYARDGYFFIWFISTTNIKKIPGKELTDHIRRIVTVSMFYREKQNNKETGEIIKDEILRRMRGVGDDYRIHVRKIK